MINITLLNLQKTLGERITIAQDTSLSSDEQLHASIKTKEIARIAKLMIDNAAIILRADILRAQTASSENHIDALITDANMLSYQLTADSVCDDSDDKTLCEQGV